MLPKIHRLRRRRDFTWVYQKGFRRSSLHLTLRGLKLRANTVPQARDAVPSALRDRSTPTRIGISISQKVSKLAVVRNRIKRQVRAALRQLLPQIKAGWYLVIIVSPGAIECGYSQFLQELEELLRQAEVIDGN